MQIPRRPVANVLVSTGHGTFIVNRNDYRIVTDGQGYGVGYSLFADSYFEPDVVYNLAELLELRCKICGKGVVALDGGANIGICTIEWAKTMHGWGCVHAFEPQERIFYALAGNISINNCFNATAHCAALGSSVGCLNVPIVDYFKPSSYGSLEMRQRRDNEFIGQEIEYSDSKCQKVPLITIDSLQLPRVDFIKLDIEGMELEALEGGRETIALAKPILMIETIKICKKSLIMFFENTDYIGYPVGVNTLGVHKDDPCRAKIEERLQDLGLF